MAYTSLALPLTSAAAGADAILRGKYVRSTRFISIGSGTSGTLTPPPDSEILQDDFGGTVDAITTTLSGGRPTNTQTQTSGGAVVAATLDTSGNWTLTGVPSSYPVALLYRVRQLFYDFDSDATDIVGDVSIDEVISDATISLSDITTGNANTSRHGFLPKLSNVAAEFLNGVGAWVSTVLANFTEAINSASPNATVPVASLSASNAASNVDLALIPKGTGALLLAIPDSLTAGGNKRGANAIDLQTVRTANTHVASGSKAIAVGDSNTASGTNSIAIGTTNVAGTSSTAIGTGNTSNASNAVAIGNGNSVTGVGAVATGVSNVASGTYSTAQGSAASTQGIQGRRAQASDKFATTGDAQISDWVLRAATSNATATLMTADGGTGGAGTRVLLSE
jgi:hypothetical protein